MLNKSGFTLIEILIVFAIMTVLGAVMLPIAIDYQQRNDLDVAQNTFVQGIHRSQQLSMSGENDDQWGVTVISGNVVIFKGSTYATRDVNFDENYIISTAINAGGQLEYDFAKITGLPAQTGLVNFVDGNYQKQVSVNEKGIVNY